MNDILVLVSSAGRFIIFNQAQIILWNEFLSLIPARLSLLQVRQRDINQIRIQQYVVAVVHVHASSSARVPVLCMSHACRIIRFILIRLHPLDETELDSVVKFRKNW